MMGVKRIALTELSKIIWHSSKAKKMKYWSVEDECSSFPLS